MKNLHLEGPYLVYIFSNIIAQPDTERHEYIKLRINGWRDKTEHRGRIMTRQGVVSKVLNKKADYGLHLMFCAWVVRKGKPSAVQMKCRERITKDQEQPLYQIQRMSLLLFSPSSFLLRMPAYGHSPTWSIVHNSSRLSLTQQFTENTASDKYTQVKDTLYVEDPSAPISWSYYASVCSWKSELDMLNTPWINLFAIINVLKICNWNRSQTRKLRNNCIENLTLLINHKFLLWNFVKWRL